MAKPRLETAIPLQIDRSMDPKLAGEFAKQLDASGVVDHIMVWDQLVGWFPSSLWQPENTPLAAVMADADSFADVFVLGGITSASSDLGIMVATDCVRRGPAELTQPMLTLAGATKGKAILMLGAGEQKQCRPFGYKRAEGLDRMEDFFEINKRLTGATAPFDYQGRHTNYRSAYIGQAATHRPRVHALGGGPRLLEMAAKYADGYSFAVPCVFSTPEEFHKVATELREDVERNGRDPDAFEFNAWFVTWIHEDPEVLERAKQNKLMKWAAAVMGRIDQQKWLAEGIEPAFPVGWHYAVKLIPTEVTSEDAEAVIERVSPEMVGKAFYQGTPSDIAAQVQGFVDAGLTQASIIDYLPTMLPLEEQLTAMARSVEVCRILKERNG